MTPEFVSLVICLLIPLSAMILKIWDVLEVRAMERTFDRPLVPSASDHSDRLRRIAALEHEMGLHDAAMREANDQWADHVKDLFVWHDGTEDIPVRQMPKRPSCPECARVKNADLCLCRHCTPLWTTRMENR